MLCGCVYLMLKALFVLKKKTISHLILLTDQMQLSGAFTSSDIVYNMCIIIIC